MSIYVSRRAALLGAAVATAAAFVTVPRLTAAADAARDGIAGTYRVEGANVDGSPYAGTLDVTAHGEVYAFTWATGADHEGVGLTADDAVAVGYGGPECGVALYRLGADGALDGRWGVYGTDEAGTERATRAARGSGVAGTYTVEGTNPDGSTYPGTLTVEPDGRAFRLTWETGGTTPGVALADGDVLAAGYGGPACGVALYRVGRGGVLDGTWTFPGAGGVGTERAVRG